MKSIVLTMGVVGGLTVGLGAADGVLIVQQMTTGGGPPQTSRVQIEKTRMRTEVTDQTGTTQSVVFDGAKQMLYMIDAAKKTYSEISKADIDQVSAQMEGAMAQMAKMKEQMASMPPAARAQMEAMMKGPAMGAAAAKTEYKKTGTDKVSKWSCDKYEGYRDGAKISELCTVDPSVLGFTTADFAVTQEFMEFFGKLLPQAASFGLGKAETQGFSGIPVKSTTTVAGRTTTTEVTQATRQTFTDADFAVPAGFTKQAFPGMGGARGRGRQ